MKIFIAAGVYFPEIGGPATYVKLLEEELPKRGFSVSVLPFNKVRNFPKILRHISYFVLCLGRVSNSDIVYAQDSVSVGLPAMLAAKLFRKRFYLRVGGDYAWEQGVQRFGVKELLDDFVSRKDYPLVVRIFKMAQSFVASRADKIIVPSEYLKKIVLSWGVPKERISVIYSIFDGTEVKESKETLREKLHIHGELIVSVGRLVPWKGFQSLIVSFQDVRKRFPDAKLMIIGSGPDMNGLVHFVSGSKLEDSVIFTGALPKEEMLSRVKAADLFVLNTGYEGFSHQLLEVFAQGTPVITTPSGGNGEMLEDGHTGVFVGYNDEKAITQAILRLLQNDIEAKQMALEAKEIPLRYSRENMLEGLMRILK